MSDSSSARLLISWFELVHPIHSSADWIFRWVDKQSLMEKHDSYSMSNDVFHMSDELFDKLGFSTSSGTCDDASEGMWPSHVHYDNWQKTGQHELFINSRDLWGESAPPCETTWRVPTFLPTCFHQGCRDGGRKILETVLLANTWRVST